MQAARPATKTTGRPQLPPLVTPGSRCRSRCFLLVPQQHKRRTTHGFTWDFLMTTGFISTSSRSPANFPLWEPLLIPLSPGGLLRKSPGMWSRRIGCRSSQIFTFGGRRMRWRLTVEKTTKRERKNYYSGAGIVLVGRW